MPRKKLEKDDKYFKINSEKHMYQQWYSAKNEKKEIPISELKQERKRMLVRIIENELPEKQREYFLMYFYHNMTVKEISEKCGVTKSTVSKSLKNAALTVRRYAKYLSSNLYNIIENGEANKVKFYRRKHNRIGRKG